MDNIVLHIIPTIEKEYGGPVFALDNIIEMLKEQGVKSEILTIKSKGGTKQTYNAEVHEFESSFPFKFYKSAGAIEWFENNAIQYDAVYLHGIWAFLHLEIASICRKKSIDYVIRPHSNLDPLDLKKKYWLKQIVGYLWLKKLLKKAKSLHTTAQVETDRIKTYGADVNFYQVGLPIPKQGKLKTELNQKINKPVNLLFLSRIHPKKGLDFLITTLAKINRDDFELTICGTGKKSYEAYIKSLIKKNNLSSNVIFKGFVSGEEKKTAIEEADAFVLSSHFENFGNVIFEMLRFNKPVIISKNIFIWKELSKHDVGWFLDLDEQIWEETLTSILKNPQLLIKEPEEYINALNEYSFEELGPKYKEMLVN